LTDGGFRRMIHIDISTILLLHAMRIAVDNLIRALINHLAGPPGAVARSS
jgi:hypothetical protein